VAIRPSTTQEVDALLNDLRSERVVTRDAAVARLTVIGARAVARLLTLAKDAAAPVTTRASAWRALDAIGDPRILADAITAAGADQPDAAIAAIGALRTLLGGDDSVQVLDRLTGLALDQTRPGDVRVAAIRALGDCDPGTVGPVFAKLSKDDDPAVAAAATMRGDGDSPNAREIVMRAADGALPDRPALLKGSLARVAGDIPVTALHQVVQKLRDREAATAAETRSDWTAIRATVHLALAERDSRLALYDLRETIEGANEPVAVEFLSALSTIGDASCLEPIAAAYSRADTKNAWWRGHLRDAFKAIVDRHGITKRHAAIKKIAKRWPGLSL
jgi:HEAT repeat protein